MEEGIVFGFLLHAFKGIFETIFFAAPRHTST